MVDITIGYILTKLFWITVSILFFYFGAKYESMELGFIGSVILSITVFLIIIDLDVFNRLYALIHPITNSTIWNYKVI